jgi:hypothetical protein
MLYKITNCEQICRHLLPAAIHWMLYLIHGSEYWRNRPGFGWHAVSQKLHVIQYYRVLNIFILNYAMFYNGL